jgi:hypothetical protein
MNVVSELTISALRQSDGAGLVGYASCLSKACERYPPPFGMAWYGDKYRQVASDPNWLAASLVANSQKEGEGSKKLWRLAGRTADVEMAHAVRRHAVDESRHAILYIAMLDIVFPDAVSDELRPELMGLSPRYGMLDRPTLFPASAAEHILDEIIQMNIGEIRTRIHQLLLRPMITAHCLPNARKKLTRVLDSLLADETRHIEYTARLIEKAIISGWGRFVAETTERRLKEFNEITLSEVGEMKFVGE